MGGVPPQAARPNLLALGPEGLEVSWQIPHCPLHPVQVGEVLFSDGSRHDTHGNQEYLWIHGKMPGTSYTARVRFKNALGWSDWSSPSFGVRVEFPQPPPPVLNVIDSGCVRVKWTIPASGVHISHTKVQMRVVGSSVWYAVDWNTSTLVDLYEASCVPSPSEQCIVHDLKAGCRYEAVIRFIINSASGPLSHVSAPVLTNTEDDSEEEMDEFDVGKPLVLSQVSNQPNQQSLPMSCAQQPTLATQDKAIHIVFVVDLSKSMGIRDVKDTTERRIDAVIKRIIDFIRTHSTLAEASNDTFSLVTFNQSPEVCFESQDATTALAHVQSLLSDCPLEPKGPTCYFPVLQQVLQMRQKFRRPFRVILLSDGRPGDWSKTALTWFQESWLADESESELHTVGFGIEIFDFEILQQIAQLGSGGFQIASLDHQMLRKAFTSLAASITATRLKTTTSHMQPSGDERRLRSLCFAPPLKPHEWNHFTGLNIRCYRKCYVWDAISETMIVQQSQDTKVVRRTKPHTKGSMRYVFALWDPTLSGYNKMVAKESLFQTTDSATELCFVKSSAVAAFYAQKFCRKLSRDAITVLPCFLYETSRGVKKQWQLSVFCGEPFLQGVFVKWVGNFGFINSVEDSEIPESFAHFTYIESHGRFMVADIQGVRKQDSFTLTDPQVLSSDQSFGRADLGPEGMHKFLEQHRCGQTCKQLGVDIVSQARGNTGTVSPSMLSSNSSNSQKSGTLLGDRLNVIELFAASETGLAKKLLFVGECSLSFSCAAANLCRRCSNKHALPWTASEIHWPCEGSIANERFDNSLSLKRRGVKIIPGSVDARILNNVDFENGDGILWAMPYPDGFSPKAAKLSHQISESMRNLIHAFVRAAATKINRSQGRISVLLMDRQHLAWALRESILVPGIGTFVAEMRVYALAPLTSAGYQPRFGDRRDLLGREASYHRIGEAVVVQWRYQASPLDLPGGMTDTRLRRRM